MRAGEHNVAKLKDCDEFGACIDPYQRFLVVERWVHDDFMVDNRNRILNDIALLKTHRSMIYSFSIAPICLPIVMPSVKPPPVNATLTIAGWGRTQSGRWLIKIFKFYGLIANSSVINF